MTVLAVATDHTNALWNIPGFAAASTGTYPQYTTTSSFFDSAFVRCAFVADNPDGCPIIDLGSNQTDFWLHFDFYIGTNAVTAGTAMLEFWSESQTLQLGLVENATGIVYDFRKSTNGSSFAAALAGTFTVTALALKTVDIHVKIHGSTGEITAYVDGVSAYTYTGDTSTNGDNAVRYIIFRGGRTGTTRYVSQMIAADVSTVGWKAQSIAPITGAQDFSGWTGTYAEIDDVTSSGVDSVYTDTVDATVSFPIGDVASAASSAGMVIQAVQVTGKFLAETGASAENVDLGFSLSGVFWGSGTKSVGAQNGEVLAQHIFQNNPSNGSGWDYTTLNAAQVALKAKA